MKKILLILIAVWCMASLTACTGNESASDDLGKGADTESASDEMTYSKSIDIYIEDYSQILGLEIVGLLKGKETERLVIGEAEISLIQRGSTNVVFQYTDIDSFYMNITTASGEIIKTDVAKKVESGQSYLLGDDLLLYIVTGMTKIN